MEQASQPQGPVDAEVPAFSRFRSLVDGRGVFREPPLALTPAQKGILGRGTLPPGRREVFAELFLYECACTLSVHNKQLLMAFSVPSSQCEAVTGGFLYPTVKWLFSSEGEKWPVGRCE